MGGDFCCAVGCHNQRSVDKNVTFHTFPQEKARRARWVTAVRRENWAPTKSSRLCSEHFSVESYEISSRLAREFGLGQKAPKLKPDAVPTIFGYVVAPPTPHRGAFAKRRRKEASFRIWILKSLDIFSASRLHYDGPARFGSCLPSSNALGV